MSEKVIIDGCDVSGCEFYDNGCCRECDMRVPFYSDIYCDDKCNRDCTYKQLQRANDEIERLKTQYNCYACGNCKGKEDYRNLEKHHKGSRKQFDKYRKALEEIREIAKIHQFFSPKMLVLNGDIGQIQNLTMTDIYQKCNEVLKEGE